MSERREAIRLASGAEMRRHGPADGLPVVCVNGGVAGPKPGDWSASLGVLIEELAERLPELAFYLVRYRIRSWNHLEMCFEDARAALAAVCGETGEAGDGVGPPPCALLGYSMGGAVAIAAADHPAVRAVVGVAPWIPDRLDVSRLDGRRFAVIQGSWDAYLPGIPGVSAASSRRGYERIVARGVEGEYTLVRGGIHPLALRTPLGNMPVPRAGRFAELVAEELARFQASAG